MQQFEAIIFDLGNVIIPIDYNKTIQAFNKLSDIDFTEIVTLTKQHSIFDDFETGHISEQDFRNTIRKYLLNNISDVQIDQAWNALLLELSPHVIALLEQLKTHYRTLALSNINPIHEKELNRIAQQYFDRNRFEDFFNKAYYSHIIGARKPNPQAYKLLLEQENIHPEKLLFIDDKLENVSAAKSLGIFAVHLNSPSDLTIVLNHYGVCV